MAVLIGICLTLIFSATVEAACPTSATGTWGEWSAWSGNCSSCPDACNQTRLRICIPGSILTGCIVENLSCTGEATESLPCAGTSCTTTSTSTTPASTACGIWAAWSCSCCGGCATQMCTRACQATDAPGCTKAVCEGLAHREEPSATCVSPSESCKMPLPLCCEGQLAYLNVTAKTRYCRLGSK